jgi:hypothetical protein
VREKVLETLVLNCMQEINEKKFNAMMEYIVNQNLLEMMKGGRWNQFSLLSGDHG